MTNVASSAVAEVIAYVLSVPEFGAEAIVRIERTLGLLAHRAPALYASFWYPGACGFIVFMRPGTWVKWLPEQEDDFSLLAPHDSEWPR